MAGAKSDDTLLSRMVPYGRVGQTRPRPYRELLGVLWENKRELRYAWNILNHGVCDGCSLGPYGLRDNVLDGVHLCMMRLKLLRLNTIPALNMPVLRDAARLRKLDREKLRSLGRLPCPMIRQRGDPGFSRITWDEAFATVCRAIRDTPPHQMGFFATSGGLTNEVYYVFQKLARSLGTNNVGLCSRLCHAASVSGLKSTLGIGAPTCSLSDFVGTDLLVIFGSDPANDQPVMAKYIHYAKQQGTRIIEVNPTGEFEIEPYWAPSVLTALYGTKLMDDSFSVAKGGDVAFIHGALKALIATDKFDRDFISKHTGGFEMLKDALQLQSWEMLEQRSGLRREAMERFARLYGSVRNAVLVYSTGFTQYGHGADNVKAVVNLALARGMLGRAKCGIMPLREHSGLHGGEECGVEPDKFPGGFAVNDENSRRFSNLWRHPVPSNPGLKVPQMLEAAHKGEIRFLYAIGGDPLETLPDRNFVAEALQKVSVRVHQDTLLNGSMLLDPEEIVLILPSQTRYEQRSGGTSTSIERRIRFTPEIPGHAIGEALPEWEIPAIIGRKIMPNGDLLFPFNDTQSIREEMGRVMPIYQGVEKLKREGDQLQWGGPFLFKAGQFSSMPGGRALFTVLDPPASLVPEAR